MCLQKQHVRSVGRMDCCVYALACVYDSFRGSIIVIASCHGTEQQRHYRSLLPSEGCVCGCCVVGRVWLAELSRYPVGRYIFLLLGFIENCNLHRPFIDLLLLPCYSLPRRVVLCTLLLVTQI